MHRPTSDELEEIDDDLAHLLAVLHPSEMFRRVVQRVPERVGAPKAFAGVLQPGGSMRIDFMAGMAGDALRDLRIDPGRGLGGQVLDTRRPGWVHDYAAAAGITHHYDALVVDQENIRGLMAVPVFNGDELYGVLYAASSEPTEFGDRVADLLLDSARKASVALSVAERSRHAAEIAAMEERRRIALDLHDSVGATLFALTASVRNLIEDFEADPTIRHKVESIEARANEAALALRNSVQALSAPPDELALSVALRADCRAFGERASLPCRLIVMDRCPPLPHAQVDAVVRTVREGLLNVEKHADARSVVVTVFPQSDGVAAAVSDDGVGPAAGRGPGSGVGLEACRERIGRVGGTLSVTTNDDGGTTLRVWVPR